MMQDGPEDTKTDEARRLTQARRERGFADAKAAADYFGWNYTTYSQHERGERGLRKAVAEKYAKAFRVPLAWLTYGTGGGADATPTVAIVGKIGANARPDAVAFSENGEGYAFDYGAPLPPNYSEGTRALEVEGESMRNIARDGWLIYYDQDDVREPPTDDLIGELCICWTEDGRVLFKELQHGMGDGFWNLESSNAPTIRDVVVRSAALVTSIVPRGKRPNTDQLSANITAPAARERRAAR